MVESADWTYTRWHSKESIGGVRKRRRRLLSGGHLDQPPVL